MKVLDGSKKTLTENSTLKKKKKETAKDPKCIENNAE
jgi:hypothetical protein